MYSTEGIVLKKYPLGEADAGIVIFTKDHGKIRALAQGVKKQEAKLKGHVEPFNLVSMQFVLGKYGERLTYAYALATWPRIRASIARSAIAAYITTLIDTHVFMGEKDEGIWRILSAAFLQLETEDLTQRKPADMVRDFEKQLMAELGYGDEADIATLDERIAKPFILRYND